MENNFIDFDLVNELLEFGHKDYEPGLMTYWDAVKRLIMKYGYNGWRNK